MGIMVIDSEPGCCMYVLYTGVPLPALHLFVIVRHNFVLYTGVPLPALYLYVIVRHNFVLVLSIHSTTMVLYMNSLVLLGGTNTAIE
jgi:hypothetical protein